MRETWRQPLFLKSRKLFLSPSSVNTGDVIRQLLQQLCTALWVWTLTLWCKDLQSLRIVPLSCQLQWCIHFNDSGWLGWDTKSRSCSHTEHCFEEGNKECQKSGSDNCIKMFYDWRCLKKVVCYMKRTGKNAQMQHRLALDQEVEAPFSTVCDVVEKFIKASGHAFLHLDESTILDFAAITTLEDHVHGSKYPWLNGIVNSFKPFRHVRTQLESSSAFIVSVNFCSTRSSNIRQRLCWAS